MLIDQLDPTPLVPAPVFLGSSRQSDTIRHYQGLDPLRRHFAGGYYIARAHGHWIVYRNDSTRWPDREIGNASTYNGARAIVSAHIASSHGRA